MFELEVLDSEAFFKIKTNIIIVLHMITVYANQFDLAKNCGHLSDAIWEKYAW